MPLNNTIIQNILKAMTIGIGKIADEARKNASWSSKIPGAIRVDPARVTSGGVFQEDIVTDLTKAPMAAAFEFGSGLHRTRGNPALYPIRARNAPELHFWWEKRQKWFVGVELPFGHPGVAPKPFIKPAIDSNLDDFRKELAKAFKEALLASVPKVTIIHGQK